MNTPHSPRECTDYVFRKVHELIREGIGEASALTIIANRYGVEFKKLLHLWLDRERARAE